MNVLNDISDEEFVPFLQSLGVETYKKSFEWMLNEPDFAGVLRWLYHNLDHNNALSAREEYRYAEIEKKGLLLSLEELETAVTNLQKEYDDLCLPGDKDAAEDIKMDLEMQKERLEMLEKQEIVLKNHLKQNELIKEELNLEVTKLHSAEQQCKDDETTAAEECLRLAEDVESITEGVVDVVADALDMYSNCNSDEELSKRFFSFGPFEAYRQTQALFRSHFDLYTARNLESQQKNSVTYDDPLAVLLRAKNLEERLADAAFAYIESKAELSGEQAKLALVSNYNNVRPCQISSCLMESQSATELLEQEESILEQQVQDSVMSLVVSRTRLAMETTARSALACREKIHRNLSHLLECTSTALVLDRALYSCVRAETHTLQQLVQLCIHLRTHIECEAKEVRDRIESMNQICSEHNISELKLQSSDVLMEVLCKIFGVQPTNDVLVLVKAYTDLLSGLAERNEDITEAFGKKEADLEEFINSTRPLRDYIWDGCTKQPNCLDRTVATLTHALKQDMSVVEKKVLEASGAFTSVKNGDKNNLRKLWQWFLTDPAQLASTIKAVAGKGHPFALRL